MMKKHIVSTIVLVCFGVILSGCSKNKVDSLVDIEVTRNTTMVMKDGAMQAALVEDFDKEYYDQAELQSFIDDTVTKFTKVNGENTVKLEKISVKDDKKAYATFSYNSVENYSAFEDREVAVMDGAAAANDTRIGDTFVAAESGSEISKADAVGEKDCKVVIIAANEEDVRVEGQVLSFSNGELVDKNTVKCGTEGYTVVVFK